MKRTKDETVDMKPGDLVAVIGGSVGKEEPYSKTASIATVVAVGLQDILVEVKNAYPKSVYKVAKKLCQKINLDVGDLQSSSDHLSPEVGDLVLSYSPSGYGTPGGETLTGVLYKISYRMGEKDKCTIMSGTDFHEVKFVSLLVLQKS